MKRTLSLLLCLTLLFGVSGFPAWADNLNVDSYYTLPESMTVDGVTITSNGQIMVSDEKILSVLGDIDSAAARASLTIENAKLNVGGNFNADGNTPDLVILGCNGAEIKIDGDLRAKTSRYGTALAVSDGTTVEIGGSVIGNTGENSQYSWTIEAGSWSSEDMRPSYVRVGKDVQGNIAAYDGSTINVNGNAEGIVYASGEGASISIGDYLKGELDAYDNAAVSVHGDVVSKVKAIQDDYVRRATAIIAQNGAAVTVDGSVSAINSDGSLGTGINANPYSSWNDEVPEASTVEVTGDVQGQIRANYGSTVDVQGHAEGGVYARGEGTEVSIGDYVKGYIDAYYGVTVDIQGHTEGDVHAGGEGTSVSIGDYVKGEVEAYDHATISVNGDVTNKAKPNENDVNFAYGVTAYYGSSVTVDGNVSAINSDGSLGMGIDAYSYSWNDDVPDASTVKVTGDVQGQIRANYGTTIDVKGHAEGSVGASGNGTSVTVGDYVKGEVEAYDHATVSVNGDVTNKAKSSREGRGTYAYGVTAQNGAFVTVDGNVSAINSNGMPGTAIDANPYSRNGKAPDGSTVEVSGNVQGEIGANYGSTVDVKGYTEGGVNAFGESTKVSIGDYLKGYIDAYNGATVDIQSHAEGEVYARGEGTEVSIGDYVKGSVSAYDHATVSVNGDIVNKVKAIQDDYVRRATAIIARNGAAVTVDGNVSAINSDGSLGTGIDAQSYSYSRDGYVPEGSTVEVSGNVQGQIRANYGATVDVKGHAEGGVNASGEGTSVTIGDGVKYESDKSPYYYSSSAVSASDHATVSVNGDVVSKVNAIEDDYVRRATAIIAQNGASVTVDGNVSAINSDGSIGMAISANSYSINGQTPEGSTVDVKGHAVGGVSARGEGTSVMIGDYTKGYVSAYNGSTVDVQGHLEGTVQASGKGTHVTIGDGIDPQIPPSMSFYYASAAIDALNHAQVDVIGDVDGSIHASRGGIVDVSGDARRISIGYSSLFSSDLSDDTDLGSTVRVGGDVANGVFISMNADGTDQSKVTIEGTISSKRDAITLNIQPHVVMDIPYPSYPIRTTNTDAAAYQKAIEEYRQAQDDYYARQRELLQQARNEMNTAEGVQTIIDNLPQIIVGTLAPDADFVLVNGMMNQKNRKQVTEALLSQINYIVNTEGVDTANIAVYGYEELDGYLVAREQQKLTVKCINDNMVIATVSAGRYATIEENKDGSYTITVQRGGDLNLVVTARPKVVYASMDSDSGADYSGTNSAYDEAQWGGWLSNLSADYANRKLILDLRTVLTTDIPYDTLRAYLADYGIGTLLVITENAEYTMTLSELLALAEEGNTFTFSVRDGALELAVNGSVVSTFSVE